MIEVILTWSIGRMLKCLAAYNLIKEVGKDTYVATPFSQAAIQQKGVPATAKMGVAWVHPPLASLPEYLDTRDYAIPTATNDNPAKFGLKHEGGAWGFLQSNPKVSAAFHELFNYWSTCRPYWYDFYPVEESLFSGFKDPNAPLLVDVGSGLGQYSRDLFTRFPNAPGTVVLQDQATVLEQAQSSVALPDKVIPIVHDFFKPQPESCRGAKAYYMHFILNDWPEDKCKEILSHLHDAMVKGYSKLLIGEIVMQDTDEGWYSTSIDIAMMALFGSQERDLTQWRQLLEESGFTIEKIWHKSGPESLIEAVVA